MLSRVQIAPVTLRANRLKLTGRQALIEVRPPTSKVRHEILKSPLPCCRAAEGGIHT